MIKLPFIILLSAAFSLEGGLDKQAPCSNGDVLVLCIVPLLIQKAFFRCYFEHHLGAGVRHDILRLAHWPFM